MNYHKHWMVENGFIVNKFHPITMKHNDVYSMLKHDIATGVFHKWVKRNKLKLVDATYDLYEEKLKEKLKRSNKR